MTVPLAPATAYQRLLARTRARGFAAGQVELQRMAEALRLAARQLRAIAASDDLLAAERAIGLTAEINAVLRALTRDLAVGGQANLTRTVQDIVRLHRATVATFGVEAAALARLDAVSTTVLSVLAARRGGTAVTYQTLIRRHIEDAAPAVDRLVSAGIARGQSIRSLGNALADLLDEAPVDPAWRGIPIGGLSSIASDARMIARSETMTALRESNAYSMVAGGVVAACFWQVNGNHPLEDECDDLAELDAFGFGPGFWPPDRWPFAPHPNCGCTQGEVILRDASEWGTPLDASPAPDLDLLDALRDREYSDARQQARLDALGSALAVPSRLRRR